MMNQLSQQLLEMPIEDQVDADDGGFLNFMTVSSHHSLDDRIYLTAFPKIPAKKCSKCEEKGITVWVVPGKCCPDCGALVD